MNVPGNAFFDVNDQSAQAEQKRREWQKIQDAVQPVILELGKRIADRITPPQADRGARWNLRSIMHLRG
ncbi:hypothetical protein C7W88_00005 [Novosphingobium sp. THN1]|uniref:hypothetical protein n=1 Tax=Novosphingobium sp. THN1 TaxID=1016987 RepID=UPI000E520EA7|nr:hypothetical protein [Novosphingobium sp. THN1]AXU20395.1 hypothetical protein C7W88_00005 [Novosphingobium sp. THN1]